MWVEYGFCSFVKFSGIRINRKAAEEIVSKTFEELDDLSKEVEKNGSE